MQAPTNAATRDKEHGVDNTRSRSLERHQHRRDHIKRWSRTAMVDREHIATGVRQIRVACAAYTDVVAKPHGHKARKPPLGDRFLHHLEPKSQPSRWPRAYLIRSPALLRLVGRSACKHAYRFGMSRKS